MEEGLRLRRLNDPFRGKKAPLSGGVSFRVNASPMVADSASLNKSSVLRLMCQSLTTEHLVKLFQPKPNAIFELQLACFEVFPGRAVFAYGFQ